MSAMIQHGSSPASCQVCLESELEPSLCCTSGVFYESFHGVPGHCTTNLPLCILHFAYVLSAPVHLVAQERASSDFTTISPADFTIVFNSSFGVDRGGPGCFTRILTSYSSSMKMAYGGYILRHGAFCSVTVLHLPVLVQEGRTGLILLHLHPHCTPGVPIQSTA